MSLSLIHSNIFKVLKTCHFRAITATYCNKPYDDVIIDSPESLVLCDNNYKARLSETLEQKKARLIYQSRKRGMLENDLLLSTFAHKYLKNMDKTQIEEYDKLINLPSNDWDIYNWAVGKKPTPKEFDSSVMKLLQTHTKNIEKEKRFKQPNLH